MDTIRHMEKILSGQTFTDILSLCFDLDLERSNPIFQQDSLAYDAINQLWLQTDQQFRRYSETSQILIIYMSPRCDLDIEDSEPISPHDKSPHDNTPSYQIWYIKKNG